MTISEVIKQLEAYKEKYGDVEVVVLDEYGTRPSTEVDFKTYHDDSGQIGTWLPGVLIA